MSWQACGTIYVSPPSTNPPIRMRNGVLSLFLPYMSGNIHAARLGRLVVRYMCPTSTNPPIRMRNGVLSLFLP